MTVQLHALRAAEHRFFIGPEFGGSLDGEEPAGLTYLQIIANPKLADLGKQIYGQIRAQFATEDGESQSKETEEDAQYRMKLESWANVLEIMLDEVLNELESLKAPRILSQQEIA